MLNNLIILDYKQILQTLQSLTEIRMIIENHMINFMLKEIACLEICKLRNKEQESLLSNYLMLCVCAQKILNI